MTGVFLKNGLPGWSGLEAGFHRLESGHETILHRHNFYELEIVIRGRGVHRIHGRVHPFAAGECWLIGGIDSHGISCETEVEVANLSFRGDSLPEELVFLLETAAASPGRRPRFCSGDSNCWRRLVRRSRSPAPGPGRFCSNC